MDSPTLQMTALPNLFKQYIEEESDGAITVTVYNNDQLAGGNMMKGWNWLSTVPYS